MTYTIFFICTTIVFGLYFAILVIMDSISAKKVKKASEEVFDNSSMSDQPPEEPSTVVNEISADGGYTMVTEGMQPEPAPVPEVRDSDRHPSESQVSGGEEREERTIQDTPEEDDASASSPEVVQRPKSEFDRLKEVQESECEAVYPEYQKRYDSIAYSLYFVNHSSNSTNIVTTMAIC